MIQGSKGYWLTTPILAIQVFTDHMQVRELLHLMGVEQAECNMASVHKKIYIAQWILCHYKNGVKWSRTQINY